MRLNIDPRKVSPVPPEDIARFKAAMRLHVIEPWKRRRIRQAQLVQQARQRVIG